MRLQTPPTSRPAQPEIRIVIAEDHAIVRDGLRALVDAQPGTVVVGQAGDGEEAWQLACTLRPNVLLLDLSMPRMNGADAAQRIAQDCPPLLALTMHEERGYVTRLLRAGAAGYVLKRTASSELVRAIRTVADGGTYVDPSLAGALLADQATRPARASADRADGLRELTPRETEVLRLVALGHSNKEIGTALEVSVKTVETHRANAMGKLGLRSRAALVALRDGRGMDVGLARCPVSGFSLRTRVNCRGARRIVPMSGRSCAGQAESPSHLQHRRRCSIAPPSLMAPGSPRGSPRAAH